VGPLMRFYRASDGWFFLGATEDDLDRVTQVAGLGGLSGGSLEDVEAQLEGSFAQRQAGVWVESLRGAGVGAHEVVGLAALMEDALVRGRHLSVTQASEEVGEVTMPGLAIAMTATPPRIGAPVRQPGADAARVLETAGLGSAVESLERRWAVQTAGLPGGWE
jgi:crotonobetainyl-CoA:carnitine CoA-transferase CaiB-like acyl-CoA transferase